MGVGDAAGGKKFEAATISIGHRCTVDPGGGFEVRIITINQNENMRVAAGAFNWMGAFEISVDNWIGRDGQSVARGVDETVVVGRTERRRGLQWLCGVDATSEFNKMADCGEWAVRFMAFPLGWGDGRPSVIVINVAASERLKDGRAATETEDAGKPHGAVLYTFICDGKVGGSCWRR